MVRRRLRLLRAEIHCDDCGKVLSREQTGVSIIAQVTFSRCLDCTLAPEITPESESVSVSVNLLRRLRDGLLYGGQE